MTKPPNTFDQAKQAEATEGQFTRSISKCVLVIILAEIKIKNKPFCVALLN
jgi:hypothetical protein